MCHNIELNAWQWQRVRKECGSCREHSEGPLWLHRESGRQWKGGRDSSAIEPSNCSPDSVEAACEPLSRLKVVPPFLPGIDDPYFKQDKVTHNAGLKIQPKDKVRCWTKTNREGRSAYLSSARL